MSSGLAPVYGCTRKGLCLCTCGWVVVAAEGPSRGDTGVWVLGGEKSFRKLGK